MSTTDQTNGHTSSTDADPDAQLGTEPVIPLDLSLAEAEALRAWLLRSTAEGATALEDPLVSRVMADLSRSVDAALSIVNVRRELEDAGLAVDHLSDDEVRELGRRVTEAALPAVRA